MDSRPDPDDPGLLSPAETALLTDLYELTMAASYHRRGMNDMAVFELFVRQLPPRRNWLLAAGLGPALSLVEAMRYGPRELDYLQSIGFEQHFLDHLAALRFSGDVDAMPEGTILFENEPLLRVTAPRIEAQLLETLLLNQLNFQTAIATKAGRISIAIGNGRPDTQGRLIDFSPRRDHGVDAAVKAARSAAIGGAGGTSNVAAAMRYGLQPVGTMAHSYVMSFKHERHAFIAFMEDTPHNTVMLVDTYDTLEGVRHAIEAARTVGVPLGGVRIDSGDLLALSRAAREALDDAGMRETQIVASGDLDEDRIARLVAEHAPIDRWGVGTDLGTSRDAPAVGGVYKLVADHAEHGDWRGTVKTSPGKATLPGPKQVFRRYEDGQMRGDVIASASELLSGQPLLVPAMREGRRVGSESLDVIRARALAELEALPAALRDLAEGPSAPGAYPVRLSEALRTASSEPIVDG
jgi:nicotinate phosphoribosyltransferase